MVILARKDHLGCTLAEMLVSVAVLALLVVFVSRVFSSAASVTTNSSKHIDCDLQARQLFDRMASDFAQMVKRPDVDYYAKSDLDTETGNDRIAFFSQMPGYYPSNGSASPTSLVAYRVNSDNRSASFNKMQRMGKGLVWNGVSASHTPFIFGSTAIAINWPNAIDSSSPDPDYEIVGPQTFRFEYFYFLRDGTLSATPGAPGLHDVAAISTCIALVDPTSKLMLSNSQLSTLAGRMHDFSIAMRPGDLLMQWQTALDNTNDLPHAAISAIRLYQHSFDLLPKF
jgi:type II secretory pathway component PulJ